MRRILAVVALIAVAAASYYSGHRAGTISQDGDTAWAMSLAFEAQEKIREIEMASLYDGIASRGGFDAMAGLE